MRSVEDYKEFVAENFEGKLSVNDNFGTGNFLYYITEENDGYCLIAKDNAGQARGPKYFDTLEEAAEKIYQSYFKIFDDSNKYPIESLSDEELAERLFGHTVFYQQ